MKYLLIEPLGGLANRMRSIESAVNFSAAHHMKLIIIWERNGFLNGKFSDCFADIKGAKILELDYLGTGLFSKVKRRALNGLKRLLALIYTKQFISDSSIEKFLDQTNFDLRKVGNLLDEYAARPKGIYMKCCYEFYPNKEGFILQISSATEEQANRILKDNRCDVGIHIRRTDHTEAISNSPLHLFVNQITARLATSPEQKFYLSTDSTDVANELTMLFESKIITGISDRNRHTQDGIRSALIDLYCLGSCSEIWGSDQSSFSERAARRNNAPLKILSLRSIPS